MDPSDDPAYEIVITTDAKIRYAIKDLKTGIIICSYRRLADAKTALHCLTYTPSIKNHTT